MQAEQIYKSFVEKAKYYLKELDFYGKFQFELHPVKDELSVGQLYDLLIHGTTAYHLKNISDCLKGINGQTDGKKNWKGRIAFNRWKKFPFPFKKGLTLMYKPRQPESPTKIKDDLYKFLKVMNRVAKEIDEAQFLNYKTQHPSLGYLNALEWYSLIDYYFKHYIKLKKKLDPTTRSATKELALEEE